VIVALSLRAACAVVAARVADTNMLDSVFFALREALVVLYKASAEA